MFPRWLFFPYVRLLVSFSIHVRAAIIRATYSIIIIFGQILDNETTQNARFFPHKLLIWWQGWQPQVLQIINRCNANEKLIFSQFYYWNTIGFSTSVALFLAFNVHMQKFMQSKHAYNVQHIICSSRWIFCMLHIFPSWIASFIMYWTLNGMRWNRKQFVNCPPE